MTSVSTAISETGESIVPDSTTTNLERMEEFSRGQDILYKAKDGKYYLGTVAELDPSRERCLVKFADGTDSWALFKQLERLSAPTPPPIPSPQPQTHTLDANSSAGVDLDIMFLRMCVVCKHTAPVRLKEIAQCTRCGRGYHATCHVPVIAGNVMKDEKAHKWLCQRCYDFDLNTHKSREIVAITNKTKGPDKNVDLTGIGIPKETLDTLKDLTLPYDLESLSWDPSHRYNVEQRYCYCGLNGDWTRCMLQCGRCKQWFHAHCIACLRRPLYAGDQFYIFVCAICHRHDRKYLEEDNRNRSDRKTARAIIPKVFDEYGEEMEFIRRLEMKWVDLIHLMLFNLTTFNSRKYFDLDSVLIPYIRDNWHGLQLPLKIANCSASERRNTILAVLTTNRNRFKLKLAHNTTTSQNSSNTWGLRVRLPPPSSTYILPINKRITERLLKQHWSENRRIELLNNPPIGSEFTMGGLLVTRAIMHCDKVGSIMRGVAYQDSADSELDDVPLSSSASYQNKTSSAACQTTSSSTMLRQRVNPVQYAPGSVKKSASTVAPGNKKITGTVVPQGKDSNKVKVIKDFALSPGIRDWNKPPRDRNSMNNNERQSAEDDDTALLYLNKSNGINNKQNKKRMLMKRNETRKLLRRKCRMEQERNKTEKRRTRLSLDASKSCHQSDSSYPSSNILPPTPPTSISDPPTPPATAQSTDDTSDPFTNKHDATKLTRANLSDRDTLEPCLPELNRESSRVNTPCDTSGDETSSKSTLDLIIPPPKDFEGRNNPFSLGEKGQNKGKAKSGGQLRKGLKQGVVAKTLKRQLSAKDIRIGPNGEVKRRRIRRSLPLPTSSTNIAASSNLVVPVNQYINANASSLTGDDSWTPSVSNCVEYVLNGRRLRVRQEKQLQQQQQTQQQLQTAGDDCKKSLMVIGGVVLEREGSVKASPVKRESQEGEVYSMDDLKSSVSSYFGAATRIAAGERYSVRARRIGPKGNVQYLIEWDGTASTNLQNSQINPLYSTPQHYNHPNSDLVASSSSSNNQYYHSTTPNNTNSQAIHNPYYNRTTSLSTSKISSGTTVANSSNKSGSSSTSKLVSSSKGRLSLGSSKGSSLNVARVLTLDSLRTFNSEL